VADGPTISRFFEAMPRIAVAREDSHFMTQVLQANCGIDNKTLGTPNA
jgi:hypothetical protein